MDYCWELQYEASATPYKWTNAVDNPTTAEVARNFGQTKQELITQTALNTRKLVVNIWRRISFGVRVSYAAVPLNKMCDNHILSGRPTQQRRWQDPYLIPSLAPLRTSRTIIYIPLLKTQFKEGMLFRISECGEPNHTNRFAKLANFSNL